MPIDCRLVIGHHLGCKCCAELLFATAAGAGAAAAAYDGIEPDGCGDRNRAAHKI